MARPCADAGLSRIETASLIWPRPLRLRLACLDLRIVRLPRDRAKRPPAAEPSGYLLSFAEAESPTAPASLCRANAARRRDHRKYRRQLAVKPPSDRTHQLSTLPAIPNLSPLGGRIVDATTILHSRHSIFPQRLECCVHLLRPAPISGVRQTCIAADTRASHVSAGIGSTTIIGQSPSIA